MINVGVIGYGYWGPNLVRNFIEVSGCRVAAICDQRTERLDQAGRRYPQITVTTNTDEVIDDPRIDALAIATPVSTHHGLARRALLAGKHVLVEKPLAGTARHAEELIASAASNKRVLMVDHTFAYTQAVLKIRELVASNEIGDLFYYDSVRVNLGLFQHDVNVLWDLAVHDLSIMDFVLPLRPRAVSAVGVSHLPNRPEDVAYLTLLFDTSLIAHIHVNWLAPVKIRRTLIGGSQKMIVYDDLEPSEKIRVYDKGITVNDSPESVYEMLIGYRTGDMWAPHLDVAEALRTEINHFIECIEAGESPVTDGGAGLRVVRILDAANRSLKEQGRMVALD